MYQLFMTSELVLCSRSASEVARGSVRSFTDSMSETYQTKRLFVAITRCLRYHEDILIRMQMRSTLDNTAVGGYRRF